jgi:hypothetical protein
MVRVELSLQTKSEANMREHWATKARRVKMQRGVVTMALRQHVEQLEALNGAEVIVATLIRVSPRRLDDDNLRGALKAVRDAIAAWVGIDDGSSRWDWRYEQRKGPLGVQIEIKSKDNG